MPESVVSGVEILDPTVRMGEILSPAPQLVSLDGKVLGLLDNTKEKAEGFLRRLGDLISERYRVETVVYRRKQTYSRVAATEIIDEMGEMCDAAITAMGA